MTFNAIRAGGVLTVAALSLSLVMTACQSAPAPQTSGPTVPPATAGRASKSPLPPSTSTRDTTVTLSSAGVGRFPFGSSKEEVSAYLTEILGRPEVHPEFDGVGQCEGGAGLYASRETYGQVTVTYYANDDKSTSPEMLASWLLATDKQPDPPLMLADSIPVGLTMEQLQARFPNGGDFEYMGFWDIGGVLISPTTDDGEGAMFSGLMDWCT